MNLAPAVALLLASASPSAPSSQMDTLRVPFEKHVLPNGLTLIVHEDHATPIVSVNLWYHVGSRNERRGRTGFAHLFEHFFFNGSENHPSGFREAMDDLGANNRNGTTSTDRTNFFEDVPVPALERTLWLEADRMGFLAGRLSDEMLERERGVVKNEKRQNENQPYGRVFARMSEILYPHEHPYSWVPIGEMADLDAATMDDIRDWYQTYYGPNNCVLVLSGDITSARALELVTRYFGPIPPGPPLPRHEAWVPRLDRDRRDTMADRVPQARIYRAFHAPPWGHADLADLIAATNVLSGSASSRLERRLVHETRLATSASASIWEREIASLVMVTVTVAPGADPSAAERELDSVLARFLEQGPTAEELDRARTRLFAEFARGLERLLGRGAVLAENETYAGRPDAHLEQLAQLEAATPAGVRATCRTWMDAPSLTLLVTPHPKLEATASAGLDRSRKPELGPPPAVGFPELQERRLANGLRVLLLERHGAPLVQASLSLDAGSASDPAAARGTASFALEMLPEGTTTRDAFAIADALDRLGATISTSSSLDSSYVRLEALSTQLGGSLDLLADVALRPAFAADALERVRERQLARIAQEKSQPTGAALRLAPPLLYGEGHPYAAPLSGSGFEETARTMTAPSLAAWHAAWFRPGSARLVVSGDVTMDALLPAVEKAFGRWPPGTAPAKALPAAASAAGGRIHLIDKPDAPQSVIVAAHVSNPLGQPDDLAIENVIRGFGGMATSRLMRNLRLEKHWSYGVSALLMTARGQRPFAVVAPVQTDKTKESMLEIAKELADVAGRRPIEGEEFESLMRGAVSRLPARFETIGSLVTAGEVMAAYDVPFAYYRDYATNTRALAPKDLAAAAARYIRPEQATWIVVGDLAKIEAGLRELGWGEVVRLDADGRRLP